ncbi:AAA family ATPase [Aspergillus bombycis]|uniref:AAA family ATPase n=1 Tax=Aspergillus bombycis TaxID=109264 RepID=A0A1F7ZLU1_9EURO|nr:AAA family ATPase [Aspergillus bombycis]OGM40392.1 AAA family ATPase [Aspergillus bombycis]
MLTVTVTAPGADLAPLRDQGCFHEAEAEAGVVGVAAAVEAPDGVETEVIVELLALQIACQGAQKSIVVEKLTKNVTESHLREIFGSFGGIESLDLPMNKVFMTNRGTAYILYNDPADAEAAIAHMHEAQLDGAVLNVSIVLPRRAFSRSPPPQSSRLSFGRQRHSRGQPPDSRYSRPSPYPPRSPPHPRSSAALGPWKDMTFIVHGLYLDHDRHVALDHRNSGQRPHRGGDSCALAARDVVDAAVLVIAVMTTAATVTEVEAPAGTEVLVDMVRKGGESHGATRRGFRLSTH